MAGPLAGMKSIVALGALAAGLALGAGGVTVFKAAQGGSSADIGPQVRAYLLDHPEVLPEAMAKLQARETGKRVGTYRAALETPYRSAWVGAAQPDVTLVQFFDYACGFCRASVPDLERLLAEDKKLRIVFRELPILGPGSEAAAKVSLAAADAGRFMPFHRAMYAAGQPTPANIAAVGAAAGVTATAETPAMAREIQSNLELARGLEISGTPAFIVGDTVLNGAVGYDALKQAITEARARRG